MTKTVGIVGGIAPESTVEYYRRLIASYREQTNDGNYPSIIINSINLKKMIDLIVAGRLVEVTEYLVEAVEKLARAGVEFAAFASNTPHIVFDETRARSSLPLISIVEATCNEALRLGLRRVGLFGTRFTMQGKFYPAVFAKGEIELITPNESEQEYIHTRYMSELVNGVFLPATREKLLEIAAQLQEREGIDGLVLGGTELPLILRVAEHNGLPLLDTTRIHVKSTIAELMS